MGFVSGSRKMAKQKEGQVETDHQAVKTCPESTAKVWERYQPMTMFDSITFRACSRSVPVSCI